MSISNRDRHPDVDFLPDDQIIAVGDVEGTTLVKVGVQRGTSDLVVARSYTSSPATEELFAVPLSELLAHTFGAVNIREREDS